MAPTYSNPSTAQPDLVSLKGVIPLIGLTGGIGSGKSTVSHLLGDLGAGVIDTDLIAHQITAPRGKAIPAIEAKFGSEYIDAHGALIRPKMRTLIFEDPKSRLILEQITHPLIREETTKQAFVLAQSEVPYLLFVVPLLIESASWRNLVDYLIVVDCSVETQISRVMQRNNIPRQVVENILRAQAGRQERLQAANVVIENEGDLKSLELKVFNLHQKLLKIGNHPHSSS